MKHSVTRLGIGLAAVVVGLLQIISVAQVRDHPYDGYLAGRDHVVIEVTPGGPAQRAGLRPGDRIMRLDGAAADDSQALDAQPRARIGDNRALVVERGGTPVTLAITLTSMPLVRVVAYLASNLTGISFLVFGLWALLRIPRTTTALLALAGIGLGAAFVEMPYFASPTARALQDVVLLPVALFGFMFLLHFTLLFPARKHILSRRFTLPALYGPPALVAIAYVLGRATRAGGEPSAWPVLAALVIVILAFTMSAAALVHSYVNADSESRATWGLNFLLVCMFLGFGPIVSTAIGLVAPRVVLPGADYYDVVWVLIPFALARAAVRHGRFELQGPARALVCVIVCLLAPAGLAAQNKVVAEIPITVARNKTVVPVTAGGTSLRLILDTGMHYDGILIFDKEKVDVGAFAHLQRAQVAGAGAGEASGALTDDSANFQVGGVAFENQRVTILTGESFKGSLTDGVIGYSLLGHHAVEIDYDRNRMTLYESESFAAPAGWEPLDIYFKNNRIPWIDILMATEDEPLTRIATYIDSASSEALELLSRPTNRFRIPTATRARHLGRGLSGDIYGHEGTIARMRIGSHQLTDVVVAIAPAEVRSKQDAADGVLGNNALRRFNVIFDYAHNKMYLRRNSHFSELFR